MKRSIRDLDVQGKTVLVRVDFNVPLDDEGHVADATRIAATLRPSSYLREHGAKVVLMAHFGRPNGKADPKFSLKPVAEELSRQLGADGAAGAGLRRAGGRADGQGAPAGRGAAAGERPLPPRGGEERPGLQQAACLAGRPLRQRRLRGGPPRARLDGRHRRVPAVGGRLLDAQGAGSARRHPGEPEAAVRRDRRRRQGLLQARRAGEHAPAGRQAADRRRDGEHVPQGARPGGRQVAAGGRSGRDGRRPRPAGEGDGRRAAAAGRRRRDRQGRGGRHGRDRSTRAPSRPTAPSSTSARRHRVAYAKALDGAGTVLWNGPMGVFEIPAFAEGTRADRPGARRVRRPPPSSAAASRSRPSSSWGWPTR